MGIALFGTILRSIIILKDIRGKIMSNFCVNFHGMSLCFRFAIFENGGKIGRFDLQHHKKLIIASIVFHIAITLATVRTAIIEADAIRIYEIVWSQLGLGIISGISTTELLVVLTGGFRSLENDSSDIRELNTERTDSDPIIECNICLVEFSASRIPRILKKCGHTICERCADILLRQRCNLGIACPMCQTVKDHYGKLQKKDPFRSLPRIMVFQSIRTAPELEPAGLESEQIKKLLMEPCNKSSYVGVCGKGQDEMITVIIIKSITLSGTILRVVLILKDIRGTIMFSSCWVFYLFSVCSRIVYFEIGVKIGRFDLQHHKKLIIASTVFHTAITVATVRSTIGESEDLTRILEMLWSQLGLGIVSGISTTEFLMVLTGGFRSLESDLRELNTERTDSDPIIECNICFMEFSASRIPRILKKCGHTICECCADILLRQRYNHRIACPMCQTVTEHYVMLKLSCQSTISMLLVAIATVAHYSIVLITVDSSELCKLCWVTIGCAVFYKGLEILKNRMTCRNNMMIVGASGIIITLLIAVFCNVHYNLISFNICFSASSTSFYTIFIFQSAKKDRKEFDLQKMDVHSWNDVTMYCFAVLLGFLSIFGLLGLIFSENFDLSTAYHIAGSSAVVTVTLVAMKYTLEFFNRYFEVDEVKRWRNNIVVGLAGIVICGVAPRIVVYSFGIEEKILPFLLSIPIYSSILFYYLFVYGYRQHCFINHQNQNFFKIWIPMVNITFSVILARMGIHTDLESMIYIQALFFVLSVFSGVDLVIILNGGLRSIHEEMKVESSENVEKSTEELKPKKRIYPRILCTSCDSEYSDSKPPRILPECGHSICGNCARRKLSKKNKLTCPACQTVHFVKKGVKGLFKNFTLLDMIEEARKIMDEA
ncbi:hypothetical protein CRE_10593 [Caenorhabditis remanei]|uniref:RING-type domain-containing protein n=1 Tax=Caenorhabditis remanei TaxID=31234 RepID=E3NBJ9_CAERE|nr:hypothetical protein CRE_10593 [Caenorhabditis remanei]